MDESARVVPFAAPRRDDPYSAAYATLTDTLVRYVLLDSFDDFERHDEPFPFVDRTRLLPTTAVPRLEHRYQKTAFVIMLDGALPRSLVKHFRVRESNRVTWRNIQRLAPHLDLSDYKSEHCQLSSPEAHELLRKLSSLDYALLIQEPAGDGEGPCSLTHMHVKVERLTDNAIKDLSKALGYIDRRLFERGEDYVDALESKFFEYHGFPANASGRKSAAAMAAQLLAADGTRFSVFVAAQDDGRLTVLDESDLITQYLLVSLDKRTRKRLRRVATAAGEPDVQAFVLTVEQGGDWVVLYRVRLRRTAAARPGQSDAIDRSLNAPWLEIADETVLPPPGRDLRPLPFPWALSGEG